jgi:multidrug efflux pump
MELDLDRTRMQALGVAASDVFNVLQVALGSYYVNNFSQFGRTWRVRLQPADDRQGADIKKLMVRNSEGKTVALGSVLTVRQSSGPAIIERFNMYPAVTITANPAPGVSLDEARKTCDELVGKVLPAPFRAEWVIDSAARK